MRIASEPSLDTMLRPVHIESIPSSVDAYRDSVKTLVD